MGVAQNNSSMEEGTLEIGMGKLALCPQIVKMHALDVCISNEILGFLFRNVGFSMWWGWRAVLDQLCYCGF